MNNKPKISVIMSIYNTKSKEYLEKSINSILKQTFKNFEFIIYNDGSTNDCFSWAKEICSKDNRCLLINCMENKGLAYALNKCLDVSQGEYIARMDDDDESLTNRFERQVEILDKNENVDVVNCNINVFDDNGIYGERIYNENIEVKDFIFNSPIVHPAVMVRKKAYDLVRYRDIDITYRNEDYDLFMRMLAQNVKMYTVQDKLFNFREDKNSYSRRKYKYRINEYKVRHENFKNLGLLPKYYIFCLKPLIVGLMPYKFLNLLRRRNR